MWPPLVGIHTKSPWGASWTEAWTGACTFTGAVVCAAVVTGRDAVALVVVTAWVVVMTGWVVVCAVVLEVRAGVVAVTFLEAVSGLGAVVDMLCETD